MHKNKLLSSKEAASYLGLKINTLAVWACTKRYALPYIKIGGRRMYRQNDLDNFIEQNLINYMHHTNKDGGSNA